MPSTLRTRFAYLALMGAFLIPVVLSSLRGLTHVLACEQEAATPFTLLIPESGPPEIQSSTRIERGDEGGLCGGLSLIMAAGGAGEGRVKIVVSITNNTDVPWRGTVALQMESVGTIPVGIGGIPPDDTESDELHVNLDPGTHELDGSLLIGP